MINIGVFTDRLRDRLFVLPSVFLITIHTVNNIHMVSNMTLYRVSEIQPNASCGSAFFVANSRRSSQLTHALITAH